MSKLHRGKKKRIYVRDHGICHYCAVDCIPFGQGPSSKRQSNSATLDHVETVVGGGGNHDSNLVLACHSCNNLRNCIPYVVFKSQRLWNDPKRAKQIARIFAMGVHSMYLSKSSVWLLEMYCETGPVVSVQNYGVFADKDAVERIVNHMFPDIVRNTDDSDEGYIGYHFPADHILKDVSFVANSWDVQS